MNPNQDLIDVINLNKLGELNKESLINKEEQDNNAMIIERTIKDKTNKLQLHFNSDQELEIKKKKIEWEEYVETCPIEEIEE